MAFFNSKNRCYYRSNSVETEIKSISEPRIVDDEVIITNRLQECAMRENSIDLPNPKDTELSKQLKLGVKLNDYSKQTFIHNRDEYMSDEQANKVLEQLNNSNDEK